MRTTIRAILMVLTFHSLVVFLNIYIKIVYKYTRKAVAFAYDLGLNFGVKEEELRVYDDLMKLLEWYLDRNLAVANTITSCVLFIVILYRILLYLIRRVYDNIRVNLRNVMDTVTLM